MSDTQFFIMCLVGLCLSLGALSKFSVLEKEDLTLQWIALIVLLVIATVSAVGGALSFITVLANMAAS